MMALKATSVRLGEEYVAREEWTIYGIEKAIKAANDGQLVEHSDVKAKWESKKDAAQLD
jgi:predicted transcriptional regulator